MRIKVFLWLPRGVHSAMYFRDGIRWLKYAWLDLSDGLLYTTEEKYVIDCKSYPMKIIKDKNSE